uniref:Uncharacterized protein n=1 Tax=Phytophthora fragariae TaxID=53985 RepID=A0A6A3EKV4_9STRA|nr:hypothetical protein PF009_g17454 [Phytophthora fragariae]
MFGASPAEKKQRMDEVGLDEDADDEVASLDDAWDDREVADDAAFSLEEGSELSAEEKKPASDIQVVSPTMDVTCRDNGSGDHEHFIIVVATHIVQICCKLATTTTSRKMDSYLLRHC